MYVAIFSILLAGLFDTSIISFLVFLIAVGILAGKQSGVLQMAIAATIVDLRGKAYEPIIEELLFSNKTVEQNLVAFETDVKSETIFTENTNIASMQAYTSGVPSSAGTLTTIDTAITPIKVMFYQEFDPNTLRSSRFKRTMKPGAWNTASTEFEKTVLVAYGNSISADCELKFWSGITAATKTAIAALTPGTGQAAVGAAEQTWAAAQTAVVLDGVVARMIYNGGALGSRIKRLGTTITSSNIAAEYAKVYGDIPALVINSPVAPFIYAPYGHKQLINIFNITATYRDLFDVSKDKKTYFYNGIEIKFVPLPDNCMVAARPDYIIWCTDLLSDMNYMEVNKIANNRDDMFLKNVLTQFTHIVNQRYNVLYLG